MTMTQHYVGTKIVLAWEQNQVEGSGDGQGAVRLGYAVKYEDGYTSWSPAAAFEAAYLPLGHIGIYPPHIQRMIGEHAQLQDRLQKLQAFIGSEPFRQLDAVEQRLLREQSGAMSKYSAVLGARLARAGVEA